MLLVVDHRDSFTWNLVHALGRFADDVVVRASEELTVSLVRSLQPRGIVLSPGPGRPEDARTSLQLVDAFAGELPMFGVCLGHQIICTAFSARVVHAPQVFHGRVSNVCHDQQGLFAGVPTPFSAARYHSLMVDGATLPSELMAQAFAESGELMAVRHRTFRITSVQFHPESFLTDHGGRIVQNFVAGLAADSPVQASPVKFSA